MNILLSIIALLLAPLVAPFSGTFRPVAPADSPWSRYDNETAVVDDICFTLKFFTYKRGNSIRNARLCLCDNTSACFRIDSEMLNDVHGDYCIDGMRFHSSIEFTRTRTPGYRYGLTLRGIFFFNSVIAGTAHLQEYGSDNRLLQDIPFLFFGSSPEEAGDTVQDGMFPF